MTSENPVPGDRDLAQCAQRGDLASYEVLVCRYEARLYGFVLQLSRNEADAREVTQDAFVTAFQKIAQYDAQRSFAAWLFTIARNKCIDRGRRPRFETVHELPEIEDWRDPAALLDQRESEQGIWQFAQRTLSSLQYQAVWLKYHEEMSIADMARVLGKTQVHVKVILFRARAALERGWPQEAVARGGFGESRGHRVPQTQRPVTTPGALKTAL